MTARDGAPIVAGSDGQLSTGAATSTVPDQPPAGGARADRRLGWLAVAATLAWPIIEAIRIIVEPAHEVLFGDYALFELATRRALRLHQFLGPSATPGFHHPGPAMFYLLAPAVWLLQPGPGLYLGAVLINMAALVATVVFVWRRAGPLAALWAAVALNLFCLGVDLDTLRQPYNSLLIIVPMVLFVVLWAAATTRVAGAWLWAAVIGSYELQTHLTTAVFVVVMLSLAGFWSLARGWWRASLHEARAWWCRPARLSGLGALVLIWLPSTVEVFVDHPNNVAQMWHWMWNGQGTAIPLRTSVGIVLRSIATFPSHHHSSPLLGSLTWWTAPLPPSRSREVAGLAILVAGAFLTRWLLRRGQGFTAALAVASLLAAPLATLTVTRAGGDNFAFLTGWLAFVPYVLLLALGLGLLGRRQEADVTVPSNWTARPVSAGRKRLLLQITAFLVVATVACATTTVIVDLRQPSVASVNKLTARTTTFIPAAEAQLKPGDRWVGIRIVTANDWETAAGVVLELVRRGYRVSVDPRFAHLFGKELTVVHPVQVLLSFYSTNDPGGVSGVPGRIVSTSGGVVMTASRPVP